VSERDLYILDLVQTLFDDIVASAQSCSAPLAEASYPIATGDMQHQSTAQVEQDCINF
jgi:hypothetical protein